MLEEQDSARKLRRILFAEKGDFSAPCAQTGVDELPEEPEILLLPAPSEENVFVVQQRLDAVAAVSVPQSERRVLIGFGNAASETHAAFDLPLGFRRETVDVGNKHRERLQRDTERVEKETQMPSAAEIRRADAEDFRPPFAHFDAAPPLTEDGRNRLENAHRHLVVVVDCGAIRAPAEDRFGQRHRVPRIDPCRKDVGEKRFQQRTRGGEGGVEIRGCFVFSSAREAREPQGGSENGPGGEKAFERRVDDDIRAGGEHRRGGRSVGEVRNGVGYDDDRVALCEIPGNLPVEPFPHNRRIFADQTSLHQNPSLGI